MRGSSSPVIWAIVLIGLAGAARAQTHQVTGQAGILAEWDLTATVTEQSKGQWTGPFSLKHVGFCSVDGPEEKIGELRLRITEPAGELTATMLIDGEVCTFSAQLKDDYDGTINCPNRRAVPMMLLVQ